MNKQIKFVDLEWAIGRYAPQFKTLTLAQWDNNPDCTIPTPPQTVYFEGDTLITLRDFLNSLDLGDKP